MIGWDDGKLLLGLDPNGHPLEDVVPTLKQFNITVDSNIAIGRYGLRFYSIQSQAIREDMFACFGMYHYTDIDERAKERRSRAEEDKEAKESLLRMVALRNSLLEDAAFWMSFAHEYLKSYDEIWLCNFDRYAYNRNEPLIEIDSDQLTAEHFLRLNVNQTIAIRKRG